MVTGALSIHRGYPPDPTSAYALYTGTWSRARVQIF
jgi:hypothetical protein